MPSGCSIWGSSRRQMCDLLSLKQHGGSPFMLHQRLKREGGQPPRGPRGPATVFWAAPMWLHKVTLRVETVYLLYPSHGCVLPLSVWVPRTAPRPEPSEGTCIRLHKGGQSEVGTCPYSRSDLLHSAPGSTIPELRDPGQVVNFSVLGLFICKIKKSIFSSLG